MKIIKRVKFVAVLIAAVWLCASIAAAEKYKTAGYAAGATIEWYDANAYAYATISPIELEGKLAYLVSWGAATSTGGGRSQYVRGIAPATCIRPRGTNGISVDFDLNVLLTVMEAVETNCTTETCVTSMPLSAPFKGFFEPFTGALSDMSRSTGNHRSSRVDWYTTFIYTSAGEETRQTANFTGAVGPAAVTPFRWDGNAFLNQRSGSGTTEVLPTPPQ